MHDGGVVVPHLAGVSQPPAVAVAVVRAVGVAAVVTHGQTGGGPDPGILVELGRSRILLTINSCLIFCQWPCFFLYLSCNPQIKTTGVGSMIIIALIALQYIFSTNHIVLNSDFPHSPQCCSS